MIGQFSTENCTSAGTTPPAGRAPWSTPRVIVSDLVGARANTIIPGGDGSLPSYGPYGS